MAGRIKFRGGTTAEHSTFIGSDREITVDTTKKTLVLHDDVLAGGYEMARQSNVDLKADKSDTYTKAQVDTKVSQVDAKVDTEKGRIDAILSASEADKDSFKEIVDLINSVDTANDTAFAGYVLSNDAAVALKAPLASPVFTGSPSLPTGTIGVTQAVGDNTTKLATTAFVSAEIANDAVAKTSQTGSSKLPSGTTAQRDTVPQDGYLRFNSTLNTFEGYYNGVWNTTGGNLFSTSVKIKNLEDTKFTLTHPDGAGAINIDSNNIATKNNTVLTGTSIIPDIKSKSINHPTGIITVTAWNYSGTTITLTVASHAFIVGDTIEVKGLTTTDTGKGATSTYVPNGVWTVTSVTSTTIVFTASIAPTVTNKSVSSASVKGIVLVNGIYGSLGILQNWQDVTASRTFGVTYTNTSGKPIQLLIVTDTFTSYYNVIINGLSTNGNLGANVQLIIPDGYTYSATVNTGTLDRWFELR